MSRNGTRSPVKKRVIFPKYVTGLPFTLLQSDIRWISEVRLHQLRQDDECLLSEVEWPKRSGVFWYVCVSSGLLFDKQTGACRQSTNVVLLLDTVAPAGKLPAGFYGKWRKERKEREKFDWRSMKWVCEDDEDGDATMG